MIKADFEFGQNLENFKFDFKIIKQKITQNVRYWIRLVRTRSWSGFKPWEKPELNELIVIQFVHVSFPNKGHYNLGTSPGPKIANLFANTFANMLVSLNQRNAKSNYRW